MALQHGNKCISFCGHEGRAKILLEDYTIPLVKTQAEATAHGDIAYLRGQKNGIK